ncbi:MAG TPA: sugar phosphate nucleotidyltransferase [bacterium]|nr:sugar phosphate nucleotidyltransferase [bacterium]
MQAVILAAGRSTRTYPLTVRTPKALYEVAGHSIIELNLRAVEGLVDEAVIVVGFMGEKIIRRLGSSYRGIRLRYVEQKEQKGTGHALLCAADKIAGEALVLMGDDLYRDENFEELFEYPNAVLAQRVTDPDRFGVFTVEGDRVTGVHEKPARFVSDLANTGCFKINADFLRLLTTLEPSERGEIEMTGAAAKLAAEGKLNWVESNGGWYAIGYPWHLLEANTRLIQDRPLQRFNVKARLLGDVHRCVTVNILEDSWIGRGCILTDRVMISRNCYLHPGVQIMNRTTVGPNTQIAGGTQIGNCLIGANVQIGRRCLLTRCVIGDGATLGDAVTAFCDPPPDGKIYSTVKGERVEVDLPKFGAVIGPDAYVAPMTVLMPGVKIAAGARTEFGEVVQGDKGEIWPESE